MDNKNDIIIYEDKDGSSEYVKRGDNMILVSKTLSKYYGNNPYEYDIKFIHYNIDVSRDSDEEYKKISEDFKNIYELDNESFIMYFSDVENYIKITSYIDISKYREKIYLRVRSKEEYERL